MVGDIMLGFLDVLSWWEYVTRTSDITGNTKPVEHLTGGMLLAKTSDQTVLPWWQN